MIEAAWSFASHLAFCYTNRLGTEKGNMAQSGAATDLFSSPTTGLVHQLRQNPYVLGLASVGSLRRRRYARDAQLTFSSSHPWGAFSSAMTRESSQAS